MTQMLILDNIDEGKDKECIIGKLCKHYKLSEEALMYWNEFNK